MAEVLRSALASLRECGLPGPPALPNPFQRLALQFPEEADSESESGSEEEGEGVGDGPDALGDTDSGIVNSSPTNSLPSSEELPADFASRPHSPLPVPLPLPFPSPTPPHAPSFGQTEEVLLLDAVLPRGDSDPLIPIPSEVRPRWRPLEWLDGHYLTGNAGPHATERSAFAEPVLGNSDNKGLRF